MLDNNIILLSGIARQFNLEGKVPISMSVEELCPPYTQLTMSLQHSASQSVFKKTFRGSDFRIGVPGEKQSMLFLRIILESHLQQLQDIVRAVPSSLLGLDNLINGTAKIDSYLQKLDYYYAQKNEKQQQKKDTDKVSALAIRLKDDASQSYDFLLIIPKIVIPESKKIVDDLLLKDLVHKKYKKIETPDLLEHLEAYLLANNSPIL